MTVEEAKSFCLFVCVIKIEEEYNYTWGNFSENKNFVCKKCLNLHCVYSFYWISDGLGVSVWEKYISDSTFGSI